MAIGQVKTIDNEKQVIPLAGSVSTGNPVGSLLYTYKKLQPRNYLYCDGSTFNAGQYPALAMYLGGNVLPDYRECGFVGAEKNTTDVFDSTETDPNTGNAGTQNHDVYAQGEFKDDQIQNITGNINHINGGPNGSPTADGAFQYTTGDGAASSSSGNRYINVSFDASRSVRAGTTTHGKRKAVYVYIKAVDGVDISDEDTFLVTVKNYVDSEVDGVEDKLETAQSYSETETLTGGTWIDGKPIYRKVLKFPDGINCYNRWGTLKSIEDEDTLISAIWYNLTPSSSGSGYTLTGYGQIAKSSSNIVLYITGFQEANKVRAVAYEYTKSND